MTERKRIIIRPFPIRYVRNTALRRFLLLLGTPFLMVLNVVLVVVWTVPCLLFVHEELFASLARYWSEPAPRDDAKRED